VFADDRGVHPWSPKLLKMEAMSSDEITLDEINRHLEAMQRAGLIRRFTGPDDTDYFVITGWRHQKIEKPRYRYPAPQLNGHPDVVDTTVDDESTTSRRRVDDSSPLLPNRTEPETTGPNRKLPDRKRYISGPGPGSGCAPAPEPDQNGPAPEPGDEDIDFGDPLLVEAAQRIITPQPAGKLARSVFAPLSESHLRHTGHMVEWHAKQLSAASPVMGNTEAHLLLVLASAIHATEMPITKVEKSRVGVFVGIIRKRAWLRVMRHVPMARKRLDELRANIAMEGGRTWRK
jgi:hypothetical protein